VKCLIVDDEPLARDRLRQLLEQLDGIEVCAEAADGREALQQAAACGPDLVLLDIRMPGMDGLEAARHLAGMTRPPAVVFTTAYGDHALQAFEAQAVDYLLKPIHPERLAQALAKARQLSQAQLQELQPAAASRTHICASQRGNLHLIAIEDVVCFQADNKYVTVRSASDEVLIEESLKSLEQEFGARFLRIHRNALVAVAAIRGLRRDADGHACVVLEGIDDCLEVSRRMLPEVRRRLKGRVAALS